MDVHLHLDTFPEIKGMLSSLKEAGYKTAILSNGSPDRLDAAVEGAGLGALLDDVILVHDLGIDKPDPRSYRLAADGLGVEAGRICFLSSNSWDANGAAAFDFQVVWCNRYGQRPERLPGEIADEIANLAELPSRLGL